MESINNLLNSNLNQPSDDIVKTSDENKAVQTAAKFEALLIQSMLKSMRASIDDDSLTGSDQQAMYRDMMDAELAKSISKSGGIGLQSIISQQMASSSATASTGTLTNNENSMDLILRSKSMMEHYD